MPNYRWRPLADARAFALRRGVAAPVAYRPVGWGAAPWDLYGGAPRLVGSPGWSLAPAGRMAAPPVAWGWPTSDRVAARPAAGWRGAGQPAIMTVGGQPYRFRPLPPQHQRVAAFVPPPHWRPVAFPPRQPAPWASPVAGYAPPAVPPFAPLARPVVHPAGLPGTVGRLVYRFRPDARFPHGETLQLPAGARLSHAAAGSEWQVGEPSSQPGHERWPGYVYN